MPGRIIRFADYEVDVVRRELRKRGIRLRLQHKPFRVLELLLRRPGELVTREELVSQLWPDSHVSFEHGLNTAVNSLRQVLGDSSRETHFIETRPGLGYRFCAPVEVVKDASSKSALSRDVNKNSDAYEDYLKGRYLLDRMASEEETYKAIAFFNSAIADETCRSLAHAGIADAYSQLALVGSVCSYKVASHARSSAELAVKIDPDLPHGHVSTGRVRLLFDWDLEGAGEALRCALSLDSSSVSAHTLHASLLRAAGRYKEALQVCRQALACDPLSVPANLEFAACIYSARDFKGAIDQCWKMLTLAPSFAPAQILLARTYEQLGMYEEAVVEFQNAQRCAEFLPAATGGLGHVFAVTGLHNEAEQAFLELTTPAQNRYVSPYFPALVCAGRKQKGEALTFLEESLRQRDPAALWLKADARLDALREEERLQIVLPRLRFHT